MCGAEQQVSRRYLRPVRLVLPEQLRYTRKAAALSVFRAFVASLLTDTADSAYVRLWIFGSKIPPKSFRVAHSSRQPKDRPKTS